MTDVGPAHKYQLFWEVLIISCKPRAAKFIEDGISFCHSPNGSGVSIEKMRCRKLYVIVDFHKEEVAISIINNGTILWLNCSTSITRKILITTIVPAKIFRIKLPVFGIFKGSYDFIRFFKFKVSYLGRIKQPFVFYFVNLDTLTGCIIQLETDIDRIAFVPQCIIRMPNNSYLIKLNISHQGQFILILISIKSGLVLVCHPAIYCQDGGIKYDAHKEICVGPIGNSVRFMGNCVCTSLFLKLDETPQKWAVMELFDCKILTNNSLWSKFGLASVGIMPYFEPEPESDVVRTEILYV